MDPICRSPYRPAVLRKCRTKGLTEDRTQSRAQTVQKNSCITDGNHRSAWAVCNRLDFRHLKIAASQKFGILGSFGTSAAPMTSNRFRDNQAKKRTVVPPCSTVSRPNASRPSRDCFPNHQARRLRLQVLQFRHHLAL